MIHRTWKAGKPRPSTESSTIEPYRQMPTVAVQNPVDNSPEPINPQVAPVSFLSQQI
jgi:hypothetical protein